MKHVRTTRDHLTVEEIRAWIAKHFPPGGGGSIPRRAFCRATGFWHNDIERFRDTNRGMESRVRANLSKFILDWEAGWLEFIRPPGGYRSKPIFVHRQTPKPRSRTFKIDVEDGFRLKFVEPPAPNPRIIKPKDLFAGLVKRDK